MALSTSLVSLMESDFAIMVTDFSSVLTWAGNAVIGTASPITRSDDVAAEGILNETELEWAGKVSDFTNSTLPEVRATVAVAGVNYYVVDRQTDGALVHLNLRRV